MNRSFYSLLLSSRIIRLLGLSSITGIIRLLGAQKSRISYLFAISYGKQSRIINLISISLLKNANTPCWKSCLYLLDYGFIISIDWNLLIDES
jgi:hypothetical protein